MNPLSITAQLVEHPDYRKEWNRIVSLYESKAKYTINSVTCCANANATLNFVYGLILSIVKSEQNPRKSLLALIEDDFIQEILSHTEVRGFFYYVRFCMKHQLYRILFFTMSLALKVRWLLNNFYDK